MTVTAVRKDPDALTMTLEAEFDASPERVWQLWADPRELDPVSIRSARIREWCALWAPPFNRTRGEHHDRYLHI
jgi:hypothetical protein